MTTATESEADVAAERARLIGHVEAAYARWACDVSGFARRALEHGGPVRAYNASRNWAILAALLAEAYPHLDATDRAAAFAVEADRLSDQDPHRRAVRRDQVLVAPDLGAAGCGECGATLEWVGDDEPAASYAQCCGVVYEARPVTIVVTRKEVARG